MAKIKTWVRDWEWTSRDVKIFAEPRGGAIPWIALSVGLIGVAIGLFFFSVLPLEQSSGSAQPSQSTIEFGFRVAIVGSGLFAILQGASELLPAGRTTLAGSLRIASYLALLATIIGVIIRL